jgi:hypothetical protein
MTRRFVGTRCFNARRGRQDRHPTPIAVLRHGQTASAIPIAPCARARLNRHIRYSSKPWWNREAVGLAADTLAVVREVSMSGESAALERHAEDLVSRWGQIIPGGEQRASGGLLNAWMTYEGAAAEIAGACGHLYAADRM